MTTLTMLSLSSDLLHLITTSLLPDSSPLYLHDLRDFFSLACTNTHLLSLFRQKLTHVSIIRSDVHTPDQSTGHICSLIRLAGNSMRTFSIGDREDAAQLIEVASQFCPNIYKVSLGDTTVIIPLVHCNILASSLKQMHNLTALEVNVPNSTILHMLQRPQNVSKIRQLRLGKISPFVCGDMGVVLAANERVEQLELLIDLQSSLTERYNDVLDMLEADACPSLKRLTIGTLYKKGSQRLQLDTLSYLSNGISQARKLGKWQQLTLVMNDRAVVDRSLQLIAKVSPNASITLESGHKRLNFDPNSVSKCIHTKLEVQQSWFQSSNIPDLASINTLHIRGWNDGIWYDERQVDDLREALKRAVKLRKVVVTRWRSDPGYMSRLFAFIAVVLEYTNIETLVLPSEFLCWCRWTPDVITYLGHFKRLEFKEEWSTEKRHYEADTDAIGFKNLFTRLSNSSTTYVLYHGRNHVPDCRRIELRDSCMEALEALKRWGGHAPTVESQLRFWAK